jgi:hypothetical protein
MPFKVKELLEALNGMPDDSDVYIVLDGSVVPIETVTNVEAIAIAVIQGKGKPRTGKKFTTSEDGLIGGLQRMGASNEMIGQILGRPESSVAQRRKQLGF